MMFINTFCRVIVQFGKWVFGLAMRTYKMNYAHDPYEHKEDAMGENIQVGNAKTKSNGRRYKGTRQDFTTTMRILRVEMQSYRDDNERMIKDQEEQNQLNAAML